VLDAVRSLDPLGRPGREAAKAIARAACELEPGLGRGATDAEIATHLGIAVERCAELRRASSVTVISLDGEANPGSGSDETRSDSLRDTVADPHAVDPVDRAALNEELTVLVREVAMLGDRNRRVIALYYRDELTFREIASVLGVSESRACQIHRSALQGLRERLAPQIVAATQPA
jgi:RNA polymerase sigma factor for flagellar operon FliA